MHAFATPAGQTIGIAVIGKAPRDDIAALFTSAAPPGVRVITMGCLDGLSDAEIDALQPRDGTDTLYTRLAGNRDVKLSKAAVAAHAPATFARLRVAGATAIVLACTGEFPAMAGDEGVLLPSRILEGVALSLLSKGRLGILVPLPEQAATLAAKWARPGLEVFAEALRPSAGDAEIAAAAARIAASKPDLVAMDCMSYGTAAKRIVAPVVGVPVLLGTGVTAQVLRAMID